MAKALASSTIVPDAYRGDHNLGSCLIALEISNRIGASVLAVMQNLYVVHGKPGWSSQFLISCINASQKFSPLRYRMTGEKGEDSWGCIAWATDKGGETLEAPEVTVGMAKAEGWYGKNGSKWKTMPELMLRYRTATLFARLYAPELTMGIQTREELDDYIDVEATTDAGPSFTRREEPAPATKAEPKPTPRAKSPKPHDTTKTVTGPAAAPAPTPAPTPAPAPPAATPEPTPNPAPVATPAPAAAPGAGQAALEDLRKAMAEEGVTNEQILAFAAKKNVLKDGTDPDLAVLSDILGSKVSTLAKIIRAKGQSLKEMKGEA